MSAPSSCLRGAQALPLHTRIQDPYDEVKDAMGAEFAPGSTLGHGEVREDKWRALRGGELYGNRRGGGLSWHCGPNQLTSFEDGCARPWETVSSNVIRC